MRDDPFAKLGAIDQKLFEKPVSKPADGSTEKPRLPHSPSPEAGIDTKHHTRMDVSTHARTHTSSDTPMLDDPTESLFRKLQSKHHLSSYTFRFRLEELDELAKLDTKLEKTHPNKMSKNDLVRLGVNWLLEDYEKNGETSMLVRILARM